jgi:hypothetical protein
MKLQQLLEALKPSQYRNLVKGWDKSKYTDLFGGKYRIYIPLGEKAKDVKPNSEVESFVMSQGYEIEDYLTGIASKDNGKRKVRIGKLLSKEPELKKLFDNDSSRNSSQSEYVVVISRHPYDIAGMTSGRTWEEESCMNLKNGKKREYVPLDIKEGTLVAYLIKNTDKNIESPSARVLIKPFVDIGGSKEVAFGVEETVYGKPSPEFQQTVVDWADSINKKKKLNGIFQLNDKLYNDSFKDEKASYKVFGDIDQERKGIYAVKQDGYVIQYIKDPSETVQLEAVKQNGLAIRFIIEKGIVPSETVQLEAVKQNGLAIQYIESPSEDVQLEAVKQNSDSIRHIEKPSEAVQLEAVKQKGLAIRHIEKPSEAVQLEAVKQKGLAIGFIKNPSEAVKKYYEEHK